MNNYTTLGKIAAYSSKRVPINTVTIGNYVTVNNLLPNKRGVMTASGMPSLTGHVPGYDTGNILVGNIRPYLKKIWFANRSGGASADVLVLSVKDGYSPRYVYYSMFLDDFFAHMMRGKKGTKMPRGDKRQVLEYVVAAHEYPTQQKIAAVLSSLDYKIELNNQINAKLEAMVKTLYDYWFVQFDFPNTKGKPFKTSGGKMVWDEELKREIPEGWKCLELSEVISRVATGLNPRKNFRLGEGSNYYVTIANIDNGKIFLDDKCDKIDDEALKIINHRSDLQVGDLLFTSIEPVGITYLIQEKPKNWNINESVFTIRANYDLATAEYVYMLLSSDEIKAFTKNVSAGSIHKGVRIGVLNTFKTVYSNKGLISEFSKIIQPMLKQINILEKENQNLSELRDWLLPMLMNGQVTVK